MSADRLLAEYHRLHDDRDWVGLGALFAAEGELRFRGLPVARGPAAIARWFRVRPPEGPLVLGPWIREAGGGVAATFGWTADRVAGELRLHASGDRIDRLDVRALSAPVVPRERTSIRAVLVAPGPTILLFRCQDPGSDGSWWITPGGGIEPGEDDAATLRREVLEEVGLAIDAPGPCLWTRSHTFVWGDGALRQNERYYLVRIPEIVGLRPTATDGGTVGHRWWTLDEICATDEILVPRRLAEFVARILADGPPAVPFDGGL